MSLSLDYRILKMSKGDSAYDLTYSETLEVCRILKELEEERNLLRQQLEDIPEGCTVADAKKLREANHTLAIENFELKKKLEEAQVPDAIKLLQRVAQSTTESIAAKASQQVQGDLPELPESPLISECWHNGKHHHDFYTADQMIEYARIAKESPQQAATIPEKMEYSDDDDGDFSHAYVNGWNDCIDAMAAAKPEGE